MGKVPTDRVPPVTSDRSGQAATIRVAEAPPVKKPGGPAAKTKALPPAPPEPKQTLQDLQDLLPKLKPEQVAKVAKDEVTAFQVAQYELPAKEDDIRSNSSPTTTADQKTVLIRGAEAAVSRQKDRAVIAAHYYLEQEQKRSPQDPKKIYQAERLVREAEANTPRGLAENAEDNAYRVSDQLEAIKGRPHTGQELANKRSELQRAADAYVKAADRARSTGDKNERAIGGLRYDNALDFEQTLEGPARPRPEH
jgi:hypothetical protein